MENTKSSNLLSQAIDTKNLTNCIRVMNFGISNDNNVIEELLNPNMDYYITFVDPFKWELNRNLLFKETVDGKRDLISFYIFEFRDLEFLGQKRELKGYEKYLVISHEMFDALFNEIQLCCIKFKVDFFQVCNDLKFDISLIDSSTTYIYCEKDKIANESLIISNKNESNINVFFESIRNSTLTQLEILDQTEKLTNNYNLERLKILENDFDFYFFMEKERKIGEYSEGDISNAINELSVKGQALPFIHLPDLKIKGGITEESKVTKVIDIEKLLFPFDFFYCYSYRNFLKAKIKEIEGGTTLSNLPKAQKKIVPIQYFEYVGLNRDSDKLTDFCNQLKKHKFIHEETKVSEFKKIFSGKKVEGIIWIGGMTELQYLFKLLYIQEKKLKKIRGSHWKVVCSYFIDYQGKLFDYKKFRNLKHPLPAQCTLLKRIVSEL